MKKRFLFSIPILFLLSCSSLSNYKCVDHKVLKAFQEKEYKVIQDSSFVRRLEVINSIEKLGGGYSLWLPHIYYDDGCDGTNNLSILNDVITIMKKHETIKLTIHGRSEQHEYRDDPKLSYRRAAFIKKYLMSHAIKANRIFILDYKAHEFSDPDKESNRMASLYFVSELHNTNE